MSKRKKSSIGFDPLAWMKDSRESGVGSRESKDRSRESGVGSRESKGEGRDSPLATRGSPLATRDSPAVIALGDSLTIADIGARHAEWKKTLATGGPIEVDASALKTVDTAAFQLLTALARDVAFSWRGAPSEALRHGAGRLGLKTLLRLP